MNFYWNQFDYDNACEPEYDDENPAVLERCIVKFQGDYPSCFSEFSDDEFISLLMRVATSEQPDNAIVQTFIALIRNHYDNNLNHYIDDNYGKEHDQWLKDQSDY